MNIQLHIERLVLDGLPLERGQAAQVRAMVIAELTRLLSEQGLQAGLPASGALPNIQANAFQLVSGGAPAQIGAQVAQSIYGGIGKAP